MSTLLKSPLSNSVAEGIYNEILRKTARYYYFLGKTLPWEGTGSDYVPTDPVDTYEYELQTRNEMILVKQIQAGDVAFVIPRYQWASGFIYDMYDDTYSATNVANSGATRIEDAIFYTVTDEYNVYKCISNNYNTPSTIQPTGTSSSYFNTSDGYIWKFMYTIPIALRNRFLTATFMPITTSLRSQFYSSGEIAAVSIDNPGYGYTNPPSLTVVGDGYLPENPYNLFDVFVNNVGDGYANTSFNATSWSYNLKTITVNKTAHGLIAGQVVTISGATATTNAPNGTFAVNSVGLTADKFEYTAINTPTGTAGGTMLVTVPPLVIFSNPSVITGSESTAIGYSTVVAGQVADILILKNGYGYAAPPTITIAPPVTATGTWVASTSYILNKIISYSDINGTRFYRVTTAGTTGLSAPTHTTGTVASGTAQLLYVGKQAAATSIMQKTEATMTAVLDSGQVSDVIITNGGVGYTYATVTVTGDNGVYGSAALATITPELSVGDLNTLQSNVELLAVNGSIDYIKMVTGGTGYAVANVSVDGDGTGCTATAVITGGIVTAINITNGGSGYTKATVTITGTGIGATARAIMSPVGGHGKNAVNEFFARSLMFSSTISNEKIHNYSVTNDYRQLGFIKNPFTFDRLTYLRKQVATSCYKLTASVNITNFTEDLLIYPSSRPTIKEYRIVSVDSAGVVVQSLGNDVPVNGDVFRNANGDTFTVASVTGPEFNKFTGEMLYIDNRGAFTPNSEQTISIKTVIRF